jgi:simple sugar transport system ATP-binding protein
MAARREQPRPAVSGRAQSTSIESIPHVVMRGMRKAYGSTIANDGVDLDLIPGEIHAVLGENGAGKTTLMNTLFGMVKPDAGTITLDGEEVTLGGPADALARGIGMVHQHFMLVQGFTVAENVVLGSVSPFNLSLRRRRIEHEVAEAAERFNISIDPRRRIRDLPIDTQQRVEIFKLLYRGARVLILDEPTSSLGPIQIDELFATLKKLRDNGHSIVIVTHKLREVMEIADRVTVLRHGRTISTVEKGGYDEQSLARMMTGQELRELPKSRALGEGAAPILRVNDLRVHTHDRENVIDGISLEVRPGEIVGVAGVEGNGQRELVDTLTGVLKSAGGSIHLDGTDITDRSPLELRKLGVSGIPEDRHGWGLVLDMTVAENLALSAVPSGSFTKRGLLSPRKIRENAKRLLEEYDVRPPNPDLPVLSLSGGNQQKVVLARELSRKMRVLIAANPTQGVDVGATDYVHRKLLAARDEGAGILLVSIDLDELLKLCDRILCLNRGKIAYHSDISEVSMDDLSLAMTGTAAKAAA